MQLDISKIQYEAVSPRTQEGGGSCDWQSALFPASSLRRVLVLEVDDVLGGVLSLAAGSRLRSGSNGSHVDYYA